MLHIINKSPLDRPTLDSLLRMGQSGAVLLIEDAVLAATQGHAAAEKLRALMTKMQVFALAPDLEARGVSDRLIDGVTGVDYGGFVDLVAEHPNCQSWL
ncbi:MAG: dsrH [Rhodocyclaceae bacterium]|nr:dsrH [Rhodocyclaceae bacterium]